MDFSLFFEVNDPFTGMVILFLNGGWVAFAILALWMMKEMLLMWRQGIWESKLKFNLLAIDIPKENEQSPKAVEQFFDHLTGFDKTPTKIEEFWEGFMPTKVSLELVSIGGYVQFLIRTPDKFRDLVEAALYAQYPDAEITEVEDYVDTVPKPDDFARHWPNMEWNFWGAEIALYNADSYPIKSWMEFEHSMSQELKDPMASILEILSRLSPDEQVWIQWVIQTDNKRRWIAKARKIVSKLIGEAQKNGGGGLFGGLGGIAKNVVQGVQESVTASLIDPSAFGDEKKKERNEPPNKMLYLSPMERTVVEAIEQKAAKTNFLVKGRLMYFGKKQVFSKARGISGVYGALKQFNTAHMNGFSPPAKSKTEAWYFLTRYRTRQRMRKLLVGYRLRSNWAGYKKYHLSTEELATIWHFPVITVKAQLVQKTESKRGGAPTSLPIEIPATAEELDIQKKQAAQQQAKDLRSQQPRPEPKAPDNLPFA